ncbi:DUF63 family protein [Halococcus saccharolyticus]|nr:DUF63 family protein [Halococcus saccharolyticus]
MSQNAVRTQVATRFATGAAVSAGGLLCLPSLLGDVDHIHVLWPAISVFGAIALTIMVWLAIRRVSPSVSTQAGWMGLFVVFGQAVDAVSTAVGVDVLSVTEQVPLSRAVLELAAILPTASLIGVGWLFVIVKMVLATGLVWLVATDSETTPLGTRLLFLGAGLVGLLPGVRNLILYTLG